MTGLLALVVVMATAFSTGRAAPPDLLGSTASPAAQPAASAPTALDRIAAEHPDRRVEVIAQLAPAADPAAANALVRSLGGVTIGRLEIIDGIAARLGASAAQELESDPLVRTVSLNAAVEGSSKRFIDLFRRRELGTAYNQSIRSTRVWDESVTGDGVGVAVIDTGIAGDLPDFRVSRWNGTSRVVASAVTNPDATTAGDGFGHGTHIAGLIAGNGANRSSFDRLDGKYIGVAPEADLISVKAGDEEGNTTVLDVIEGLQFVVDHKDDYNIRVVNLSLRSTEAESYLTDPLDAAVEAAWNSGIVVVAAAGNAGGAEDAVSYAPANDPYVITVGAVDDRGTKGIDDDLLASWSSRGTTQDGFEKPDLLAPGAGLVSTIPPDSEYTRLCLTCIVDGKYFRVGGTSMSAAVVSGEVALLLEEQPWLEPDEVKEQIVERTREVDVPSGVDGEFIQINEAAADKAVLKRARGEANDGLTPSTLLDPVTGGIDYERASWSRASWSEAIDPLRASWSRASWSRASWSRASWSASPITCLDLERASWSRASWSAAELASAEAACSLLLAEMYPTRASWSASQWTCTELERASWSRASWSAEDVTSARDDCSALLAEIDPTRASWSRASWSRASWSRASWSTSFTK